MSDAPNSYAAAAPDALQFEKAEFSEHSGMTCAGCSAGIPDSYYELAGRTFCPTCAKSADDGSFGKALLFGLGASVVGALVWYAVETFAHMRIGLIAIGIGWGVGRAVRRGAGAAPGVFYSILSVLLTYGAIAGAAFLEIGDELDGKPLNLVVRLLVSIPAPFLDASPIGILIIGFGLWEAWKFSRPGTTLNGPFPVVRPTA